MLLRLIPSDTNIQFMRYRFGAVALSIFLMIGSIILFFTNGLNLGIDFKGGLFVEVRYQEESVDIAALRTQLNTLGLGDVQVQTFGAPNDVMIRVESQDGGEEAQREALNKLRASLGQDVEYRRQEVVGPTVSGELTRSGTIAVVVALLGVMAYIWLRFEWHFAMGSVLALIHDVIITIGMFSLTQIEFNLSSIAAILTIVGYSLNDTVVVFDRLRETVRRFKKKSLIEIIDITLNSTLSRTILTSLTTLIALVSLYVLGGENIRGFTFAMIWGVVIGTYSSIFVASTSLIGLKFKPEHLNNIEDESKTDK